MVAAVKGISEHFNYYTQRKNKKGNYTNRKASKGN